MDIIIPLFGDNKYFIEYLHDVSNISQLNFGLMELEKSYSDNDKHSIRTLIFDLATDLLTVKQLPMIHEMEELSPREIKETIMCTIDFEYYIIQYILGWLVIIGSIDKIERMKELGSAYAICNRILNDVQDINNPDYYNICRCYSYNELIQIFQENITVLLKGYGTHHLRNHYKDMIAQFKSSMEAIPSNNH